VLLAAGWKLPLAPSIDEPNRPPLLLLAAKTPPPKTPPPPPKAPPLLLAPKPPPRAGCVAAKLPALLAPKTNKPLPLLAGRQLLLALILLLAPKIPDDAGGFEKLAPDPTPAFAANKPPALEE
jgi:hypothetical protein